MTRRSTPRISHNVQSGSSSCELPPSAHPGDVWESWSRPAVSVADSRRPGGPASVASNLFRACFLLVHAPQHEARLLFWSRTRTPFLWPLLGSPNASGYRYFCVDLLSSSARRKKISPSACPPACEFISPISRIFLPFLPSLFRSEFEKCQIDARSRD